MLQLQGKIREWAPYFIPVLLSIFQLIQSNIDSPAFYTRIDAEYVCLLNGLNVAILNFDNIGYFVHPGTPFIVLTGLFFQIIYALIGEGPFYTDVISRPELYLRFSSELLMILTAVVLVWGGKKIYQKGENLTGMVIIQSSFLLSELCLHLPTRYTADRLLPLIGFIFAIYTIEYLNNKISDKKYAIAGGIILGIGIATKINFLPILVIPVFLIKKARPISYYLGSLVVATFISLLPIISKLKYFKTFILSIFTHEGMYGQGKGQIFNVDTLIENITTIIRYNLTFIFLLVLSFGIALYFLFKSPIKQKNRKEFYFFIAFIFSSIIQIVMVSKHYKDYYLAPILAILGLVLFEMWVVLERETRQKKTVLSLLTIMVLIILILPSFKGIRHSKRTIQRIKERQLSVDFLKENRKPADWLFLEPSWKSDPTVENGLMWGISYVAGRNEYRKYFEEVYPRVVAYEGADKPISQFRCGDADEKEIMESKDDILLMAIPGDQTPQMIDKLNVLASQYGQSLQYDTIFVNAQNKDMIIKASHLNQN